MKYRTIEAVVLTSSPDNETWTTAVAWRLDGRRKDGRPAIDYLALTNAQAVVATALRVIQVAGTLADHLTVYVRDRQALALLRGEQTSTTPEMRRLIHGLQVALAGTQAKVVFEHGGLPELIGMGDASHAD